MAAAASLILALLLPAQAPAPPVFAAGVRNVNVDVLVTRDGRPVDGLGARDFVLTDNGVRQQVEVLDRSTTPVDAVLVLDLSSSVRGERLASLRAAAHAFVDALDPGDAVTLVVFATEVARATAAAAPRSLVHAVIDRLEPGGATTLADAVFSALLLTDSRRGRPLVVVFSDGVDRGSWLTRDEVLATARASDAVVHFVAVEGASTLLAPLASATGGRGFTPRRGDRLGAAFVAALEEFKSRYRLRYEPVGVDAHGWHAIEVRLAARKGRVQARPGYQGATSRR